ncbi:MAG: hypothetical protein MUC96_10060 [Myxococcaceae bacterium]|jgi:hypothetical protein|nr:hypothetical protein [Myxococcaceae bacterium]
MTAPRFVAPVALCLVLGFSLSAWADEYPKVVRRDGQVCVQELAADGSVKESCRAETVPAPSTSASPQEGTGWANRFQGSANAPRLLPEAMADSKGASRGIAELFGGQVAAFATALVFVATGVASSGIGGLLASSLTTFAVSSLVSGFFHVVNDGQAGLGWAFLGNALGSVASFVVTLVALSTGGATVIALALIVGSLLPPLGAAIALELRDTVLRREAAGFSPSVETSRPRGAVVASF